MGERALRIVFVLLVVFPLWASRQGSVAGASGSDEIHFTITSSNSVTVSWRGPDSTIRYGLTAAYGQSAIAVNPTPAPFSSAGPFWEARLTNLQPTTIYHYSIGGGPDHTFKTALAKGASGFSAAAIGDIGDSTSYANMAAIQQLIANEKVELVLAAGDLTYGDSHGQAVVDQHFNDVMVWSQDAAYHPAWGNHDWGDNVSPPEDDLRNYKGRFDFANPQTSPGSPSISCCGEDWYWFDDGNVRFIAYPEPWSGAWSDWNMKVTALMDEAQADPGIDFVVTFGHRPAYSSGNHPGSSTLSGYLDNLGATHSKYVLNLNGHSHNYERTYPQYGVVHITVGTGGASLEQDGSCLWLMCSPPAWSARRYMRHGVTKLTFTLSGIQGVFICGPAGGGINDVDCNPGDIIDSFTIGSPPPSTPTPTATATPASTPTPTPPPAGSTLTFVPSADAYVRSDFPGSNFGSASKLQMDASPAQEAYLKFQLSGLTGAVISARLRLHVDDNPSVHGGSVARMSDMSWSEATVTYNTRPAIDGATLATLGAVSIGQWYEFDVTGAVTGDGTLSLGLRSSSDDGVSYTARENAAFAPQLLVVVGSTPTATPTPIASATATATPTPVASATGTATATPTSTPTVTAIPTAPPTVTSTPTLTPVQPPSAPSNLTATRLGGPNNQRINLTWVDNSTNEDNLIVERSTNQVTWGVIATLPANTTSHSDRSVVRTTRYYYRVRATNGAGSSAYSNVATATTR